MAALWRHHLVLQSTVRTSWKIRAVPRMTACTCMNLEMTLPALQRSRCSRWKHFNKRPWFQLYHCLSGEAHRVWEGFAWGDVSWAGWQSSITYRGLKWGRRRRGWHRMEVLAAHHWSLLHLNPVLYPDFNSLIVRASPGEYPSTQGDWSSGSGVAGGRGGGGGSSGGVQEGDWGSSRGGGGGGGSSEQSWPDLAQQQQPINQGGYSSSGKGRLNNSNSKEEDKSSKSKR